MFWEMYYWKPNQAHNGFLEIYLNLGWIGVLLLTGIIVSTYRKIASRMVRQDPYQILRMSLYVLVIVSNLTEAYFKNIAEVWFIFLLIAIEYPRPALQPSRAVSSAAVKSAVWN